MKIEQAKINYNSQIAKNIWKMEFLAPNISQEYKGPGQFVTLSKGNSQHILRRPMSVASVQRDNITIIYKELGSVTKSFTNLKCIDMSTL